MTKPTDKVTASELMERLNADPKFCAEREERVRVLQERKAELAKAEVPVLEALLAVDCDVGSVWDLMGVALSAQTIRVLAEHLFLPYPALVREGIARALAVSAANYLWDDMVGLYRSEKDPHVKDGVAEALAEMATDEDLDRVIALVRNREHGPSRLLLLHVLQRSSQPRAFSTLIELKEDPDLRLEIIAILKKKTK